MTKLVLIVEDSETCAETLQVALESLPGLEARVVHSLAAALDVAGDNRDRIAAIVTDMHFKRGPAATVANDGLDLIRGLRAEPGFSHLPILLISGDSDPLLPGRALAQGANAFFAKPYSPAAVRRKLEELLC